MNNTIKQDISKPEAVKESKDRALKIRLQTLINNKGMSEADFYNSLGISKQYWYCISWGLWQAPIDLKIKISKLLDTDTALIFQKGDSNA